MRSKKIKKKDEKVLEELYLGEKKNNKKPIWPIALVFSLIFVLIILGATTWSETFNISWFTDAHKAVMAWNIKDFTIISYVLGQFLEFGKWTSTDYAIILIVASLILKFIYKIKLDELLEIFCEGAVRMLKPTMVIVVAYIVVIITAYHPFYATISAWLIDMTSKFNIITTTLVTIIGSVFNIEMVYLSQSSIPYIASVFTAEADLNLLSLISQSMYGLTMLAAPTSIILILGLEYLNVSYIKWLKSSWKFLVELLVVILAIIIIVMVI